jgi:predicted lipid-binding transport protein (Tim44 family)
MLARTTAISQTQVLTLAADLIAVEEENNEFLASVRFSGTIREEANGPVEEFSEVWNWSKPMNESAGWILCGIQQLN